MIRPATKADIPEIVEMLIAFQEEAGCYGQITPCRESIGKWVADLSEKECVCVYEYEGEIAGTTALMICPSWFNFSQIIGQEMWWYIKPEYRGKHAIARRLFKWLETIAKERKLVALTVASTGTLKVDRLKDFYERSGYKIWDVLYTKEVS